MIGKTIGQYQVIDKIGEGGMGVVYKAEDTTLHRLVALKTLSSHLTEDEEARERFIREAQSASSLNHPNITTVFEFIEDDDTRLICMEYVEGKTIRDMVESGVVSVRKAIDIIMQAAEALEAAHNKGILHRDVKSANIMVNMEGRVKIMDFGLAHLESRSQLTRTGTTMGTLSYSSPEQISGRTIDRRSEVFSLGAVFYELLTGQLPFKASNEAEILFAIINNEPPKLSKLRDDVPELVEAVVARMLEKDPELRYPTCGDVISDLKGIRKEMETSTVGITSVLGRVQASRKKALLMRVTMVVLPLVIITAGLLILTRSGVNLDPDRLAVEVFKNRTGDESLDDLGRIAAGYLTDGLRERNLIDVVPTNIASQSTEYLESQYGETIQGMDRLREFALETGAGLVITGSYFIQASEIFFEVEIINAQNLELISSIRDIKGNADVPMEIMNLMQQRVMAVLASHLDPQFGSWAELSSQPTSFEAYRLYNRAMHTFFENQLDALQLHYQAHALDTSWLTPLIWVMPVLSNYGRSTELDSLVGVLQARSESLTPAEILHVEYYNAYLKGNRERQFDVAVEQALVGSEANYSAALCARRTNRPQLAVEYLEQMDPERGWLREWGGYWSVYTTCLHMLGEHRKELKIARWDQKIHPDWDRSVRREAFALAALGKVKQVNKLLVRGFPFPGELGARHNLALEYRAHGYSEASEEILNSIIEWYRSLPDDERLTRTNRAGLARTLYAAEQWDESYSIYSELNKEVPDVYNRWLGCLAVRRNDHDEAHYRMDLLEEIFGSDKYDFGSLQYYHACIYALLGEKQRAVNLLKEAYGKGVEFGLWLHRDVDLESLRGFPAFEEFIRPKG